MSHRISILGGGAWGVALATAARHAGSEPLLYSRRDPSIEGVRVTHSLEEAARHARVILLAIPSNVVRDVARSLGAFIDGRHVVVHGVRGLVDPNEGGDPHALETISAVVREETPARRVGAIGGPVLTEELAAGAPSILVVASHFAEVSHVLRGCLGAPSLRIYATEDLIGLEWASALTGVLAVAVGFARGVGLGAGIVAAFITRAVHEAARIAVAAGAEERTFLGLGGFGDVLAATNEATRPEVRLGEALARGTSMSDAVADAGQRIEAIDLAPRVARFATHHRVNAPIFHAIAGGILMRKPTDEIVRDLMMGPILPGA